MILKNLLSGKIIAENIVELKTSWQKSLGLLDNRNGKNIFFKTHFGIHTFFMKEPIDVLILNKDFEVAKICKDLKPNKIFLWNPVFENVVELENGTIEKSETKFGDKLAIN